MKGYGGGIFRGGRFSLTNPGAVAAFAKMVQWQRLYGPSRFRTFGSVAALERFYFWLALGFGPPRGSEVGGLRYGVFPRFPNGDSIPISVTGLGLFRKVGTPGDSPALRAGLSTLGRLCAWLYDPGQQSLLSSYGVAPVLADGSLQDGFWIGQADGFFGGEPPWPGLVPPQGWRRFATGLAGLPPEAPLGLVGEMLDAYGARAPGAGGDLPAHLETAEQALNVWLARRARG